MKVRDIMIAEVVTAEPETSVNLVAQLMDRGGLSGVPVVDGSGHVVGIVTEVDLIVRNQRLEPPAFFQLLDGRIPLETPAHYRKRLQHMLGTQARDVMTEKVVSVGPEEEVEALAELMVKRGVNPVPVVEAGRLVGIVSRADLIRMMARDLGEKD
ncbi:MAG TPA: CBS domain-containing protein [Vicinamibacteria bacterium]|nr:CBS domain-containing protein [Vicinamibacteria bacterium]